MEPATKFPDGPAKPMKPEAGESGKRTVGRGLQLHSGSGTQKSLNSKKDQPKTMRYVR